MVETVVSESPLAGVASAGIRLPGLEISERPGLGHFNLRLDPAVRGMRPALRKVLGVALPMTPNTTAASEDVAVLWLGPDEWLLLTPAATRGEWPDRIESVLAGRFFAFNDISSGQTVVSVRGEASRGLLSRGCSLDLHARVFTPGLCAQTLFAKTTVTLCQWDDRPPAFELVVRRSYAHYLWSWLQDASADAAAHG